MVLISRAMSQSEVTPTQITNLIQHEPIQFSISIQPHGVLLALNPQLVILQVSNNTEDLLGKKPDDLLGQPLSNLLDSKQAKVIEQCWQQERGRVNSFKLSIQTSKGEQYFDAVAHLTESSLIVELEPTDSVNQISFLSFHALAGEAIAIF